MKTTKTELNIYTIEEENGGSLVTGSTPKKLEDDDKIDITVRLAGDDKYLNMCCRKVELISLSKLLNELAKQIGE